MGCGGAKDAQPQSQPSGGAGKNKSAPSGTAKPEDGTSGGAGGNLFVQDRAGVKITDEYDMEKKKLGEGSYGTVCRAKCKKSQSIRAVKTIQKKQVKDQLRTKQEIDIMKCMDHPNIVKLFATFEDNRNIYLVMELCTGGELFDKIIEAGHFTEVKAAILMKQIVRAIFYMHENSFCHRDLKPENFLFTTKEDIEKNTLKIIDFGLSCKFTAGQALTTKAGTPYYVAPQVLAGKYDQASDLWSVGVIMYVMLCGYPPFFGETDAEVLSKVRLGNFSFNAADWKNISEDAKNLIRLLLKMNPKDRTTAEQALQHAWIEKQAPQAKQISLDQGFVKNLSGFRSHHKLKKAAIQVIASQLNEKEIKALREVFVSMDGNGDGKLTKQEMKEGLENAGIKEIPPDLQQIMESVDGDSSGAIDYTEFLSATITAQQYCQESVCWAAFQNFDINGDGKISRDELQKVLGEAYADPSMFAGIDNDGDGQIDFDEFMAMMREHEQGVGGAGNNAS